MTRLRRATAVVVLACGLVLGTGAVASTASAGDARLDLPPSSGKRIARIFDDALRPLGLRTTRAGLQSLDSYQPDPEGRHLAVYVEPIDEITDEQYVANFLQVARVYLPSTFKRWTDLKSFDVCQEPPPTEDSNVAPPPVTQLQATRAGAGAVRWARTTLEELLVEAAEAGQDPTAGKRQRMFVYFADRLDAVPELVAARAAAAKSLDR
jgi:hypothetical protein